MGDVELTRPGGWFVRVEQREGATRRLYAFPHAGAGPGALGALAAELPDTVEPWALNLPGRQARLAEPPRTDLEPLVGEIAADLAETPGEYALFGYCGGALLAYLAARQSEPCHLFLGSFAAPDVALVPRRLHLLPGDIFWDAVLDQGGVPPELARHTDLRPVLEPGIRADFALYAGYRHSPGAPLDVPVTVLYGRDDTELTMGAVLGWRRQTTSRPELCELPAGHWLVDEDPAGVAACLADRIATGTLPTPDRPRGRRTAEQHRPPAPVKDADDAAAGVLTTIERTVRDLVGRPIRDDENFFDAGLTSRTLAQVHVASTRELADPFPVTAMFAYPNLRALRRYLVEGGPVAAPVPALAASGGTGQGVGSAWRDLRKRLRNGSGRA